MRDHSGFFIALNRKENNIIRVFDVFSGIGGFRSGLEKAGGFEIIGWCEIDKYAKKAYETMYDTENEVYYNDARTINPNELLDFDLICAGFPCQSFSIAGKRGGFNDARGTLFFEIARIAAVKKPKYLLLENVPGLLSHDGGRTFAVILGTLDELGYDVAWQVLNSANFGVAQSRKRVFIIGFLREKCAGKVLSFTDANPKTLVQRIPGRDGCRIYSTDGLSITLTSQAGGFGGKTGLYEILGLPIKVKAKSGYQTATTSCNQGYYAMCIDMNPDPKVTELARCITTRQDSGIGSHKGEKSGVMVMEEPRAILNPFKPRTRQLGRRVKESNEPMFTLTVTDRHGVIYNGLIRRLMPIECWRLQGFTDEQFNKVKAAGMSDAQLYKQAGNAVSVPVAEAIARNILELEKEDEKHE